MTYSFMKDDELAQACTTFKTEEETLAILDAIEVSPAINWDALEGLLFSCSYTVKSINHFKTPSFVVLLASLTIKNASKEVAAYYVDLVSKNWSGFTSRNNTPLAFWLCTQEAVSKEQIDTLEKLAPSVRFKKYANPVFTQDDITQRIDAFLTDFSNFSNVKSQGVAYYHARSDSFKEIEALALNPNFTAMHADKIIAAFDFHGDRSFKSTVMDSILRSKNLTPEFISKFYEDLLISSKNTTGVPFAMISVARNCSTPTLVLLDLIKRFADDVDILEVALQNSSVTLDVVGGISPASLKEAGMRSFVIDSCLDSLRVVLFPSNAILGRAFITFAKDSSLTFDELYKLTKEMLNP